MVRNATRRCGGNFETGAVWESPIDEACNFSTSARELCALASVSGNYYLLLTRVICINYKCALFYS